NLPAAAAVALGKIGTAEAAAALKRADAAMVPAIRDARLRCAERLAADGNAAAAEAIYRSLWQSDAPVRWRLAALAGLARSCPDRAGPILVEALGGDTDLLRAAAANLLREVPGKAVTAALVERLAGLDAGAAILTIDLLAARGDRTARDAVAKLTGADDESVRAAAVRAMAALGDAADIANLVRLAATEKGAVQQAARTSLVRLTGKDVDARVLDAAAKGDTAVRVEAIRATAGRRSPGAAAVLLKAAADADEGVRVAALDALAVAGDAGAYRPLVEMLSGAKTPAQTAAAAKAVVAVGGMVENVAERVGPVAVAVETAKGETRAALLGVLGAFGGDAALAAVRPFVKAGEAGAQDAAVRALANWPDASAAGELLGVARDSDNATHRVLALRGYLRLARSTEDKAARMKMLEQVRPIAKTADAKKMLLAGLSEVADPGAMAVAESFLGDAEVKAEAALAVGKIKEAMKPRPSSGGAPMPPRDKKRSDARKAELAKAAPKGYHLVGYIDCGPDTEDGAKGGPTLRLTAGAVHFWAGSDGAAAIQFGTVAYDGQQVVFEAAALDPKRSYQVGFSWWDYDHDTRAQSVWVGGAKTPLVKLLDKTALPSGVKNEKPADKTLPLPRELTAAGSVRIAFRNEAVPNVVVSEVWLWESDAESAPPPAAKAAAPAPAEVKRSARQGGTRVLIVTGAEYPGHPWRETAPALREAIEKDPRLAVDMVEDPAFLASPKLHEYAAIVQNWMNWESPSPGPAARENFAKFVRGGKGLVLVHFACGAWQDWPEFVRIVGRVWDPKLRAHDPHGSFRVEMTDSKHAITQGLKAFETVDELYTCLAGDTPIEVLATARSKVDGKDYPMAFVLTCDKGRVFHSVLGHDVRALGKPVAELYRRATAWAAGLAP
ncbi:MAG TPA: ThuA domain-containing protein, partial [Phycisphaerae bacterium]|nr:ThuA domain-containing protein [Phycisphaerae bacterium]